MPMSWPLEAQALAVAVALIRTLARYYLLRTNPTLFYKRQLEQQNRRNSNQTRADASWVEAYVNSKKTSQGWPRYGGSSESFAESEPERSPQRLDLNTLYLLDEFQDDRVLQRWALPRPKCSTPRRNSPDPFFCIGELTCSKVQESGCESLSESTRLRDLEAEVASLREALAGLVKAQAAPPPPQVAVIAPLPPPPPPPPGPPPPPPPERAPLVFKKKNQGNGVAGKDGKAPTGGLDMREILKEMGSVTLRKVARSPGGTPIRDKPAEDTNDPTAFLTAALRARFTAINQSPLSEPSMNDCENDWSAHSTSFTATVLRLSVGGGTPQSVTKRRSRPSITRTPLSVVN